MKKVKRLVLAALFIAVMVAGFTACSDPNNETPNNPGGTTDPDSPGPGPGGPANPEIPIPTGGGVYYVSEDSDGEGDGSSASPFYLVKEALDQIKADYASTVSPWSGKGTAGVKTAWIIVEGETGDFATLQGLQQQYISTVEIVSAAGADEYPPIRIRGKDAGNPGILPATVDSTKGGKASRVLRVEYNTVTLGPYLSLDGRGNESDGGLRVTAANGGHGGVLYIGAGSNVTIDGAVIQNGKLLAMSTFGGGV